MFSRKDLQRLIIPLIIEQFLSITIGMADTVMVSVCGEAAVSGVSLVDAINILMINIFSALATGGAIVSSQYIGREQPDKACEAAKQLVLSVFALSTVIGVIFVVGGPQLLRLIYRDVETAVMDSAEIYFFLTALSYPFIALYNAGAALFRAMGNSRVSMATSIVMNCINIGGNALFIFGFNMGAAGAALATLISRIVGAIAILALLTRSVNIIHIDSYLRLGLHPGMIKNILEIGIPNGMENGMFQLGKIIVQGMVCLLRHLGHRCKRSLQLDCRFSNHSRYSDRPCNDYRCGPMCGCTALRGSQALHSPAHGPSLPVYAGL